MHECTLSLALHTLHVVPARVDAGFELPDLSSVYFWLYLRCDSMQALRERTGNGPAGRKLLQLLQTVPNRDELAHAVVAVLAEGIVMQPCELPHAHGQPLGTDVGGAHPSRSGSASRGRGRSR